MISNRNVNPSMDYEVLETYATTSKKALKKSKFTNVDDAINETVGTVAGGEFLVNCKIYLVNGKYFAVVGDVWGIDRKELKGFQSGDKVAFTQNFVKKQGVLKSFKDNNTAVLVLDNENIKEVALEDLTIIEGVNN